MFNAFALSFLHEALSCWRILRSQLVSCSLFNCDSCYLTLSYSLGSIALVNCNSIATISRRGVKEKLYFPGELVTWRGHQAIGGYLFLPSLVLPIDSEACASFLLYCGIQASAARHMHQLIKIQFSGPFTSATARFSAVLRWARVSWFVRNPCL